MNARGKDDYTQSDFETWVGLCKFGLIASTAIILIFLCISYAGMFEENLHAEFCRYVDPGQPYHLVLHGKKCAVTSEAFLVFAWGYLVMALPLQLPLILVIGVLRHKIRKRRIVTT